MQNVRSILAGAAMLLLACPLAAVHSASPGRVSLVRGEALLQGSSDGEWAYVDRNLTVLPGDLFWTGPGSLLELELPGGVVLRAGPGARFEVASLSSIPVIHLAAGPVYLCSVTSSSFITARVLTSVSRVELQRGAAARIDVAQDGTTRITARDGFLDYEAGGEVGYLSTNQRIWVEPGLLPSRPLHVGAEDDFDLWVRDACRGVFRGGLPVVGSGTLEEMGTWTRVDGMRVWRPDVASSWSPYRHGRWDWLPDVGWTWVPEESWGWVTHHYGSWSFDRDIGWIWVPDTVWHGGRVAWWHRHDTVLWAPLDPRGRPVFTGGAGLYLGDLRVALSALSAASLDEANEGTLHPSAQLTEHIGPVSPHSSLEVHRGAPPPAQRRGGRFQDASAGEARGRARAIARRASLLSETSDQEAPSFRVDGVAPVRPDDQGAEEPDRLRPTPRADRGFSAVDTEDRSRWDEPPVFIPEAGAAGFERVERTIPDRRGGGFSQIDAGDRSSEGHRRDQHGESRREDLRTRARWPSGRAVGGGIEIGKEPPLPRTVVSAPGSGAEGTSERPGRTATRAEEIRRGFTSARSGASQSGEAKNDDETTRTKARSTQKKRRR